MNDPQNTSIQSEVRALQDRNKFLSKCVYSLCISQFVLFAIGAASTQVAKEVVAQRFVLQDAKGKPRITMEMDEDNPTVCLNDAEGNSRLWLGLNPGGRPVMEFYDKDGNRRAYLGVAPAGHPYLDFIDTHEISRISMGFRDNGQDAGLTISDVAGKTRVALGSTVNGYSGLDLVGRDGSILYGIGIDKDDRAGVVQIPKD